MAASIELQIKSKALEKAMRRAPDVLSHHLDKAINRIVLEMANIARLKVPKAHSNLVNSINIRRPSPLVGEVVPGMAYARYVEQPTGSGGTPPVQAMLDWISVKGITPRNPDMDKRDLAFVIARQIAISGTEPQPYLQPAFDDNKAMAGKRMNQAIDNALKAMH